MALPIAGVDIRVGNRISAVDHHIVADVDTHMADTGGIIRSGEKHQIARFDVERGYRRADVAKPLRPQPAHIPTGMIDDPTDEARTVK